MIGAKLYGIAGICGDCANKTKIESARRVIPELYVIPSFGTFDRRNAQINSRGNHLTIRLKESFTGIAEILKNASLKTEVSNLICNNNINLFWQVYLSRKRFDEDHSVLKAVGLTDFSCHFYSFIFIIV